MILKAGFGARLLLFYVAFVARVPPAGGSHACTICSLFESFTV